jgi:hypothetical protein
MAHELEARVTQKVRYVATRTREKIVDTQDLIALFDEPIHEMRAKETCAAGYKDPASREISAGHGLLLCFAI